jgi:hypothetical protein
MSYDEQRISDQIDGGLSHKMEMEKTINENNNTWFQTEQIETVVNVNGDMTTEEIKASRKKLIVLHQCGQDKKALIEQLETMISGLKDNFDSFAS